MFGRTIKLSIAKDNGRCVEFNKKREYTDKQRCYECGAIGHLSYQCPDNVLGNRDPPLKKSKKKNREHATTSTALDIDDHQYIEDV